MINESDDSGGRFVIVLFICQVVDPVFPSTRFLLYFLSFIVLARVASMQCPVLRYQHVADMFLS